MQEHKEGITEEQKSRPTTIDVGQIFYTKNALVLSGGKHGGVRFTAPPGAQFISVLVGMLKGRDELPKRADVVEMLANIGFVGIDDIVEALGEEAPKKISAHIDRKYRGVEDKGAGIKGLVNSKGEQL